MKIKCSSNVFHPFYARDIFSSLPPLLVGRRRRDSLETRLKSHDSHDMIVLACKCFNSDHTKTQTRRFQIRPICRAFSKSRNCFRDGLVWTIVLIVEIKLRFQIPPGSGALFLRLSLPSTVIRHENGHFRKRFSNPRNLTTPPFVFRKLDSVVLQIGGWAQGWLPYHYPVERWILQKPIVLWRLRERRGLREW